jgi:hypothetical protein
MENLGIFLGHSVYFVYIIDIWHIFLTFGVFFPFWYILTRKIWQPFKAVISIYQLPFFVLPMGYKGKHCQQNEAEADDEYQPTGEHFCLDWKVKQT